MMLVVMSIDYKARISGSCELDEIVEDVVCAVVREFDGNADKFIYFHGPHYIFYNLI